MKHKDKLFEEFSDSTQEEWRKAAEKLLKGKPFDRVMKHTTLEAIELEPILWKDVLNTIPATKTLPGFDGYLRGTHAAGYNAKPWEIAQELPYGLPSEFNRAILEDLMRGQNALNITLDEATLNGIDPKHATPGKVAACGLSLACLEDVETAFNDIIPDAISFHINAGCAGLGIAALFFAWLMKKGIPSKSIHGSFNVDPLATWAAYGTLPKKLQNLMDEQVELACYCSQHAPGIRAVGVSTLPYHQSGASAVQELGVALATGVHYINAMIERGMDVDTAAQQIRFSMTLGPNFFMEIAKLRSTRVLWSKIVKAFGGNAQAQKINLHVRTGLHNKTRKDPYVNMLRTSMEALSGVIAGIDSMCIGNFDETIRLPNTFSRRIARNTHLILQEECELTSVVDPAGGSWSIEWLTHEVSKQSWSFFQTIEAVGGIESALQQGFIQQEIKNTADQRDKQFQRRRICLIGTNVYPDLAEKLLENNLPDYKKLLEIRTREVAEIRSNVLPDTNVKRVQALEKIPEATDDTRLQLMTEAVLSGATLGEMTVAVRKNDDSGETIQPLPHSRLAENYETVRNAVDAFKSRTGSHPRIFLVNLGSLRQHKARADFTRNFFATGGFEVISSPGFEQPAAAVTALKQSEATIAVVCGTDEDYTENFVHYATAIKKDLPKTHLVLAGFPGDKESDYRAAGMDDFIFIKSNNFAVNRDYLKKVGVL